MQHPLLTNTSDGPVTWPVPLDRAEVRLAEGTGHLLDGATITFWADR